MHYFRWTPLIITLALVAIIITTAESMMRGRGNQIAPVQPPYGAAPPTPGVPSSSPAPAGPATQPAAASSAPLAAAAVAAEADAAARADLRESTKLLTDAGAQVDQALERITAWETEVEPLRDNAEGRAVAAYTDLAGQIAYVFQQPRPTRSELNLTSEDIKSLRSETDRLSAATTAQRLTAEQTIKVQELHRRSYEAKKMWTEAVERVRAIAREAQRRGPPTATPVTAAAVATPPAPSATPTSPAAPAAVTPNTPVPATPAATPSSTSTAATPTNSPPPPDSPPPVPPQPPAKSLQEKVVEIIDQNQIDALKDNMIKEAKRKRDAELARLKKVEDDLRLAAEKATLVAEARSDEVQRLLQPFLARRNVQPRLAGSSVQWRHTVDQQPMSLLALENVGALAETVQGLSTLARVGSHHELSSPRWDYNSSPRTWSADTQDRLKQVQELLRRLGPTLVDERMLAP